MVSQLDLDGAGSPAALVTKILKAEPNLTAPIPIERLALQLGILEIKSLETAGFEGGLIADSTKSNGYILVNANSPKERRRFTIAHELGHFLIPTHKPVQDKFLCKTEDMRQWSIKDQNKYIRMESEANQFAALILIPPPLLNKLMQKLPDADLTHVTNIARYFEVSKEAAARAYAQYHDEPIAIAVVKDGLIKYVTKNSKFPFLSIKYGQLVPKGTLFYSQSHLAGTCTKLHSVRSELWLETSWGKKPPPLFEQVYFQQGGYALIMLWSEIEEEKEDNDERTSKQRLKDYLYKSQY